MENKITGIACTGCGDGKTYMVQTVRRAERE